MSRKKMTRKKMTRKKKVLKIIKNIQNIINV
jgi:hypothetical protein